MASYFLKPFQASSIWNKPIPVSATYKAEPKVASLSVGMSSWLDPEYSSVPVYQATSSDPIVKVLYNPNGWSSVFSGQWQHTGNSAAIEQQILNGSSATFPYSYHTYVSQSTTSLVLPGEYDKIIQPASGTVQVRAPSGIHPTVNADGHMVVYQPDGTVLETFGTIILSSGTIVAQSYKLTNPMLNGDGWQNGVTASMIPVYAGLVRKKEFEAGVIDHAMKIVVPAELLHPSFVYPALAFDRGAMTENPAYSGSLPMGARLALPHNRDLTPLGLTTNLGKTTAKAAQEQAFIITDRGGSGITIVAESGVTNTELDKWAWERDLDLQKIFDATKRMGLDAADTLTGGSARDVIYSGGGNDKISGLGGNDDLFGEGGNDTLLGGEGDDRLWGGPGKNTLDGGPGSDTAVYALKAADYTIAKTATGYAVKTKLTGAATSSDDTLINIEAVKFSDKTVKLTTSDTVPAPSLTPTALDIQIKASADLYNGAPLMRVSVDQKVLSEVSVWSVHALGQSSIFNFHQDGFLVGQGGKLSIAFLNDAWGGSDALDRNLWIDGITVNGANVPVETGFYDLVTGVDVVGTSKMGSNGVMIFEI